MFGSDGTDFKNKKRAFRSESKEKMRAVQNEMRIKFRDGKTSIGR